MVTRLIKKVIARLRPKSKSVPVPARDKTNSSSSPAQTPVKHESSGHAAKTHDEWKPARGHEEQPAPRKSQHDRPRQARPHHDHPHEERSHQDRHPHQRRGSHREELPKRVIPTERWDPASHVVPPAEGKTRFGDLDLPQELLHAIADLKFQYCSPIQAQSLPHTLTGKDIFGKAQTGTGKTAAFLITAMARMLRNPLQEAPRNGTPRVLILAPTRELCLQIHKDAEALGKYCDFNIVAVFGGMDYDKQRHQLTDQRVDIVAATPGRLLDFKQRQDIHLSKVEILVIDEADRMLDMGFIPDVREIVYSTPPKAKRQTMLFSATLTPEVQRLSAAWTMDPAMIEIAPEQVAVDTVEQTVYIVTTQEKFALLYNILKRDSATRVIVFANRRDEAERLKDALRRYRIDCAVLSGAVPQEKRVRVLEGFRNGEFQVLVATDVAGRGIHVDSVSHVINFNIPEDPEDYVHRIGRTGRAGASGKSISFACEEDSFHIPKLEEYLGRALKFTHPEDDWVKLPDPPAGQTAPAGLEQRRPREGYVGRRPPMRGGNRGSRRGPPRR